MARQKQNVSETVNENPNGMSPSAEQLQEPQMTRSMSGIPLEQPETVAEEEQEDDGPERSTTLDEPERINRLEAAYRAIRTMNGGTETISHLGKIADELFVAGYGGDEDHSDVERATWKVRQVLETLEGLGMVEMTWECVITPLVDMSKIKSKS